MDIVLYLTNKCNMNCSYCYQGNNKKDRIMSFEIAKEYIDKICEQSKHNMIGFFGGEPLLNKKLLYEIVNYCNGKTNNSFSYSITTNGTLIDDEFVSFCKKNNIKVGVSIDGKKESHDKNRVAVNGESTFDKTLEGSKKCLKAKLNCMALPVVCTNNIEELSENVKYLIDLGFKEITCNFNYCDNWDDESISVLRNQYEILKVTYFNELKKNNPIKIYPIDTKMQFMINKNVSCVSNCNRDRTCIDSDGTLYPCIQFVGKREYQIGNVHDGEDRQRRIELIKIRNCSKTPCEECSINRLCAYGCGCIRFLTTGGITEVTPLVCETEKIYIDTANSLLGQINKESEFVKYLWLRGNK